mgnify:CR=1 FL=1
MSERTLFTSESVTEGHPDKIADQISDSVLDAVLADDPAGRVACETLITTGLVVVAGEITTETYVDIPRLVRERVAAIGYTRAKYGFDAETCGVIVALDESHLVARSDRARRNHAQQVPGAAALLHEHRHVATTEPRRELAARRTGLAHLHATGSHREDVADVDDLLRQTGDREVLAERTRLRQHEPERPPVGVMIGRVHQQGHVGSAVPLVHVLVATDAERTDVDTAGDR